MNNNFVDACYTNNKYLYIKFSRNMNLIGSHSILNCNNYLIKNISSSSEKTNDTIYLSNIVSDVYYDNDSVFFKLKDDTPSFTATKLYCGYIFLSDVFFVMDINNNISDFYCPNTIIEIFQSPSIKNCVATAITNKTLNLINENTIPFYKLEFNDFYIKNGDSIIYPFEVKVNLDKSFTFFFKNEFIEKNSDIVCLCTTNECSSTNALGEILKSNECIIIQNDLPTLPISVSIISYVDHTLGVSLEFTDTIQRYDSNDFSFIIDGEKYCAKGRQTYYKSNIIYFFLYNVFDFDLYFSKISVIYKKLKIKYTLNQKLKPITMPQKLTSKIFYGVSGSINNVEDPNTLILNIQFNTFILKNKSVAKGILDKFSNLKLKIFPKVILDNLTYLDCFEEDMPVFYIENLGFLFFHLSETWNPVNLEYDVDIDMSNNSFIANIPLSLDNNFLDLFQNKINYVEFIPLSKIKSYECTTPILTLETPVELNLSPILDELIFNPDEQNKFQELLGSTVSKVTTILVDKTFQEYSYGELSPLKKITFTKNVYIKSIKSNISFENPVVNVLNIEGATIYMSLDDSYYINFDNCHFTEVVIL